MTGNFVSLYKTRKKGENSVLKLKCGWINGELNIVIIDGNTAWSGKFNAEEIESFCEVLGITRDEYIAECQQAFSGGEAVENFLFTLENNRFVWRKEVEADTRVKFGSIKLITVPLVKALEEFVDFAFETVERCRQDVTDAKNKMQYFETERTTLLLKIEEYIQNKREIEQILYSKFLCILNAKKERISILEQELSDLKSKIQQNANETESYKCDATFLTEPSSKATRETRKTNKKPYQHRARMSPPSVAVDTKSQVLSDIPVENNNTQTSHFSTNKVLKGKRNVRQQGQQRTKTNPVVEYRTTSKKKEEPTPCTSKACVEQVCEPDVLKHTGSTECMPSKNGTEQQKNLVVRSASPIASTSTSIMPLENHILVKYETADQFVLKEQETCIPLQQHADKKSSPLVKKGGNDPGSEQIKDDAESVYSSEANDKKTWKISEVICPIDLVSQKINAQSDVSPNKANKLRISNNKKNAVTSPAKQSKEFEIISPLDMLVRPKSLTPSLVHKDTVYTPTNSSLKRPLQTVNMQENSSLELSTGGTIVCQEAVTESAGGIVINDVNTNFKMNTSVAVSSANHTKSQLEEGSNHYNSDTDVDEPEDVCKLSAKHRSVKGILEDSNHSLLTANENPEVKCDEIHQTEQKNATEDLLHDSQDTDSTLEEIPMAALPKRTRRSDRINKRVPVINKSVNHFSKLNRMQDKSQNASQNMRSAYEQETQIVDTQKLLDDL